MFLGFHGDVLLLMRTHMNRFLVLIFLHAVVQHDTLSLLFTTISYIIIRVMMSPKRQKTKVKFLGRVQKTKLIGFHGNVLLLLRTRIRSYSLRGTS